MTQEDKQQAREEARATFEGTIPTGLLAAVIDPSRYAEEDKPQEGEVEGDNAKPQEEAHGEEAAPSAPALPTAGLPEAFVSFCRHVAERRNVPEDVVIMSALTIAGAAAGAYPAIYMGGYANKASLHTMIVAETASGKSEPLKDLMKPAEAIDQEYIREYNAKVEGYRAALTLAKGKSEEAVEKPKKLQFLCAAKSDAARVEFVCDNPRGGLQFRDELRALMKSLTAKNNEEGVEQMLEIMDCRSIKASTKTDITIHSASETFLAILGGIQPGVLRATFSGEFIDNGLLPRFCPVVFRKDDMAASTEGIDEAQSKWWCGCFTSLRGLGNIVWTYKPSEEGKAAFAAAYEEARRNFPATDRGNRRREYERAAYSKAIITIHRLALIAHLLNIVDETPAYPFAHPDIPADTIRWAFSCMPYLLHQRMEAYDLITGEEKPKPRTQREIIRDLAAECRRRGHELNQTKLAEATGIKRPNISGYLRNF